MILNLRINNFMVFSNDVEMSFEADMHTKKFMENVYSQNNFNIVKSALIYGANNVGKTCVLEAIRFIKGIMRGEAFISPSGDLFNIYTESNQLSLGITFMLDNNVYSFDFKYLVDPTSKKGSVTYESLKEVSIDKTKKQREKLIYQRDINGDSKFINSTYLTKLMKEVPHESIFLYQVEPQNKEAKEIIDKYRDIFNRFTDSVETVRLTTLQLSKTIDYLKKDGVEAKLIKELVHSIDADISDISYKEDDINLPVLEDIEEASIREKRSKELLSLVSTHNGKEVRSMLYDSRGTKEIIALAGYIVDALLYDKTLIVDELDSGLHYKNTRALVSMFNSGQNKCSQLIFTTHDINLLDIKLLFRKDQIWFLDRVKEKEGDIPRLYLYRLDEFTYSTHGVRTETDIIERYKKGDFGALPKPDLFSIMSEISDLKNG